MHLLRGLHFVCAYYNISLQACHVPGTENSTADAISRNLLQVFFERIPRARATPSPIPLASCGTFWSSLNSTGAQRIGDDR